jgi:dTDP-4-dehydrorhamnose 3,5-epimerase/reductase
MDESIFIVGAQGQLGTALRQQYPNSRHADVGELDITDKKSIVDFDWSGIKTIINAAAYTNVDGAETPEGRVAAWKVNAEAVANLVAVAAQKDITLVHISTEYVFDGTNELHKEDEPLSPLSSYGASKAAADIIVSLSPKHYIVRTSWVIGEGKNFVRTMLGLGQKGVSPSVVSDQVGRLTFTAELVRGIHHLLSNESEISYGTYNLTNSGDSVSWADVTREVFKLAGFDDLTVTDTTTAEYFKDKPEAAVRPLNSTLDLSLIESTGFEPRDWKEDLKLYIDKEKEA